MAAAFVYLENASGQDKGPKTLIVVAKRDIRETAALDPDKDLETLEIPARMSALQSLSLPPAMKDSYKGQRVNRNILAGTPVMLADLAAAATLELRGDARALSIPVKGANALSGLVIPGDYVKLLVTRPMVAPRPPPTTNPTEFSPEEGPSPMRYETALIAPTPFRGDRGEPAAVALAAAGVGRGGVPVGRRGGQSGGHAGGDRGAGEEHSGADRGRAVAGDAADVPAGHARRSACGGKHGVDADDVGQQVVARD
jgi:hypothetical protein